MCYATLILAGNGIIPRNESYRHRPILIMILRYIIRYQAGYALILYQLPLIASEETTHALQDHFTEVYPVL